MYFDSQCFEPVIESRAITDHNDNQNRHYHQHRQHQQHDLILLSHCRDHDPAIIISLLSPHLYSELFVVQFIDAFLTLDDGNLKEAQLNLLAGQCATLTLTKLLCCQVIKNVTRHYKFHCTCFTYTLLSSFLTIFKSPY